MGCPRDICEKILYYVYKKIIWNVLVVTVINRQAKLFLNLMYSNLFATITKLISTEKEKKIVPFVSSKLRFLNIYKLSMKIFLPSNNIQKRKKKRNIIKFICIFF